MCLPVVSRVWTARRIPASRWRTRCRRWASRWSQGGPSGSPSRSQCSSYTPQACFTFGLGAPGRFWGDVISVFGRAEDRTRRSRGLRHQGATVQGAPGYRGATSASSGALLEVLKKCPNRAQKGDCQYCPPRGPLDDAPTRPPPPLTEGRRHRVLLWAGRAWPGGHLFPKPCDHGVLRRPS